MSPPHRHESCSLCGDKLDRVIDELKHIGDRLFKDDGDAPCMQTRLDRHDNALAVIKWIVSAFGGALIAAIVALIVKT